MKIKITEETFEIIKKVLTFIVIMVIIIYFIRTTFYIDKIAKSKCSTIAVTKRYESGGNGSCFIVYEYVVKNVKYEGTTSCEKGVGLNENFFVKYLCDDPSKSTIYYDHPINNSSE